MEIIEEKYNGKTFKVYEVRLSRNHVLRIVPSEMAEATDSGGATPHSHAFEVYSTLDPRSHRYKKYGKLRSESFFIPKGKMKEIQEAINEAVREIEKGEKK